MQNPDLATILEFLDCKSQDETVIFLKERLSACFVGDIEPEPPPAELASRLGGIPWLPSDLPHPCDRAGKPMLFIAQINFAELPEGSFDKAERGVFMLFWNSDRDHSNTKDRRAFSCIWIPQPETKTFRPSEFTASAICAAANLKFSTGWSLPEHASAWQESGLKPDLCRRVAQKLRQGRRLQLFGQAGKQFDALQEIAAFAGNGITWNLSRRCDPCFHHLMAGAADWKLFLQITSIPEAGLNMGAQSMYLLIRQGDLAQQNYSKSWLLLA
jgi:uncharacterized protein YwqG